MGIFDWPITPQIFLKNNQSFVQSPQFGRIKIVGSDSPFQIHKTRTYSKVFEPQ
jgi:hypothetical protein